MELDEIIKYTTVGCCIAAAVIFIISQSIVFGAKSIFDQYWPIVTLLLIIYSLSGGP